MKTTKQNLELDIKAMKDENLNYTATANSDVRCCWISCEDSLPETEGEYLTYNKANDSQTVQYFDGRVWGYLTTVKLDVTHWTNLPPAPACS